MPGTLKPDISKAEYDRKIQEIQGEYKNEEDQAILKLTKAKERKLGQLKREYQQEVRVAKEQHAKDMMAVITDGLFPTVQEPTENFKGIGTPSSSTLSATASSPGAFHDVDEAKDGQEYGISNRDISVSSPETSASDSDDATIEASLIASPAKEGQYRACHQSGGEKV
ncbi:hypothetical protein VP1G_05449 [Cytospora mali]|uniref:Uncharacterized protein n=1 Tax=Cytospora mali TaxID=578113 RepID=A0A194V2V5_CYTMA|nr:hypothetical protein VP1G_05449 [Valsa mali var. pyri (nom. inval.)]